MPKKQETNIATPEAKAATAHATFVGDGHGFRKFKRKIYIGAIIRAILFGVSLGVITVAALWLIDKMTIVDPNFKRYAMIGGIVAGAISLAMAAILIPGRRRLAKHLDRSLHLGEKVQTMIEFRGQDNDMLVMQREDTDRILRETPRRRVKGACTWLFALLPFVAAACLAGTIMVPAKEVPPPPPVIEKTWHLTQFEEQALKDLIKEVEESNMEREPRVAVVVELETLLSRLKNIRKEAQMKAEVINSVSDIHTIVKDHNTYDVLAASMTTAPSSVIRDLARSMKTLDPLLIGEDMQSVREALKTDGAATLLATSIRQSIQASEIDNDNEVIVALTDFADELDTITAETDENTIAAMIETHNDALNAALLLQATNEEVEEYVRYELMSLFGIATADLPEELQKELAESDDGSDAPLDDNTEEDKATSGGAGSGEQIFGSNDTIYDPETDSYVSYGEVINNYYAKITEMLIDGASPEEIEEALSDYYAILYDGRKNEENKG